MKLEVLITNKDAKGVPFFGDRTLIEVFNADGIRVTSHTLKAGAAKTVTIEKGQYFNVRTKGA